MTSARIERLLRGLALAGLVGVLCICLGVFATHRSAQAGALPWSWHYIFGAVAPLLGIITLHAVLIRLPPLRGPRERYIAIAGIVAGAMLLVVGAAVLPLYELPVMAVFLSLMTVALAAYRACRRGEWLISYITLAALCLVMFVPDLIYAARAGRMRGERRLPHWGDEATFRHLFPDREPFISAGGRMQPNLDLDVATDIPGRPLYRIRTNSDGFRNDHEIAPTKAAGELRILNLGDSFSIGCAVEQDRFVGSLLEASLRQSRAGQRVTVLNAEVSDPAYGLLHLQRFGIGYAPDLVLYGYVDNDSHQAYLAFQGRRIFSIDDSGEVRTHPIDAAESTLRRWHTHRQFAQHVYPTPSAARLDLERSVWNRQLGWLLRLSAGVRDFVMMEPVARAFAPVLHRADPNGDITFPNSSEASNHTDGHLRLLGLSDWGMLYKHGQRMTEPFYATLFSIFETMQKTAASKGATFVLIYYPRREQVQPQDWRRFHTFWNLAPDDFDLDLEARTLQAFCAERGIPFIDTTPALRAAAADHRLYLHRDSHFDDDGQAIAARTVTAFIERFLASRPSGAS